MELKEFRAVIGKLTVYFDRKMPSEAAVALWFEQIKFIPTAAIDTIFNQITTQDMFPRNIGNSFRDAWSAYKSANPRKIVQQRESCDQCQGHGFLEVLKFDDEAKRKVKSVIRCGSCQNWMRHWAYNTNVGIATRSQLTSDGYEVSWPVKSNIPF